MEARDIVVHWTEIALKGKNRPKFIDRLVVNVRHALSGLPVCRIRKLPGRLWIMAEDGASFGSDALSRLQLVYGISSVSPALRVGLDLESMKEAALAIASEREYESFRISARRAFKDLPFRSLDINIALGDHVYAHRPAKVKMKGADLDIRVEVVPQGAFLYADKVPGPGGLPVAITGRVCALLSGGIDSPVAAARMMRRGCRVVFVHFHGHPFVTKASLEKAEDLAGLLTRRQYESTFYSVAFGELQQQIVASAPAPLRVVLYRRFMVRIASAIAAREKCKALVTGEALAQVASQTLSNLIVIEEASALPILRPLVGFDKQEIVNEAQRLGTFETSILPDQDCCTLFTPRSPETHAKIERVLAAESALDVDAMVTRALDGAERQEIHAPWWQARKVRPPSKADDTLDSP